MEQVEVERILDVKRDAALVAVGGQEIRALALDEWRAPLARLRLSISPKKVRRILDRVGRRKRS